MLPTHLAHGALGTIINSYSSRGHPALPTRTTAYSRPTTVHQHQDVFSSASTLGKAGYNIGSGRGTSSSRAAGVICRNRPMWARGPPPDSGGHGGALGPMITRQITACDSLVALLDVYDEWGGSFGHIQSAAALVKYSKLSRRAGNSHLLSRLTHSWLRLLPDADVRGCSNVLYAVGKLGMASEKLLWEETWAASMGFFKRNLGRGEEGDAQHVPNVLWAAAKLGKQPAAGEVQLLVQVFLQPNVLAAATAQGIANFAWAASQLSKAPGWQGGISEQDLQQLLDSQQLQVIGAGSTQAAANVLIALAGMTTSKVIGRELAQQCGRQMLSQVSTPLSKWDSQSLSNTMWATAELGLPADVFLVQAISSAQRWVPVSGSRDLTQAALACALLQHKDEAFAGLLLQRASQLLQPRQQPGALRNQSRVLSGRDRAVLAALLVASVAQLDLQQLAGPARELVCSSGVASDPAVNPYHWRRFWVFHSWLLQHQLLDGKGLTGLLTEQQLQRGRRDAAKYGVGVNAAQ